MTDSQPTSPVIAPGISTTTGVFSQVRTAVDDRLRHTVSGFNRLPHTIASGRAAQPRARITNDLVADIEAYQPKPGRQAARSLNLEVRNTPPPRVDSVVDAIQRYLNIKPRREPTADPKAEDSIARHPQQIIQSAQRWAEASSYQFSGNGVALQQFRPEYQTWGGGLDLTLENEGSAGIYAPPTRSPLTGASPLGKNVVHDPADAAQAATRRMLEAQAPEPQPVTVGPPPLAGVSPLGEYVVHDPANAAQAVTRRMLEAQAPEPQPITVGPPPLAGVSPLGEYVVHDPLDAAQAAVRQLLEARAPQARPATVGPGNMTDDPEREPAYIFQQAMTEMAEKLKPSDREYISVGHPNQVDDPEQDPVYVSEKTVAENREELTREKLPQYPVGAPNMVDSVRNQPRAAWYASTQVAYGLGQQRGLGQEPASAFHPLAEKEAYIRAMHMLEGLNRFRAPIIGNRA